LEANPNRILCGHFLKICDKNTNITGIYSTQEKSGRGRSAWIQNGVLYGATSVMFRRAHTPEFGFDERVPLSSDWKFYIDMLDEDAEYGYLPEYLGLYRKHENNITNQKAIMMDDVVTSLGIIAKSYPEEWLSIHICRSRVYYYGFGYQAMEKGLYHRSVWYFSIALLMWPFSIKTNARFVQSLFLLLLKILKLK
jgi:hypothetical protein